MGKRDFAPIHPAEVLLHDFMEPMGGSQYRVVKEISVSPEVRPTRPFVHQKNIYQCAGFKDEKNLAQKYKKTGATSFRCM